MPVQSDTEWDAYLRQLTGKTRGADVDEVIDEVASRALELPTSQATTALLHVLPHASGELTRRSVALALAVCAEPGITTVVDALVDQFRSARENEFLAPAMLDALFLLACRDGLARSELSSLLQRIDRCENRFLVEKAATICGRLLQQRVCGELRRKLSEYSDGPDRSAATEARFQVACVDMHEISSADDRPSLAEALKKACVAFNCVGMTGESRLDADVMSLLLELFVLIEERADAIDFDAKVASAREALMSTSLWAGYDSPQYAVFLAAAWGTVDAIAAAIKAVDEAECWLDIRSALLDLSRTMTALTVCNFGEHFQVLGAGVTGLTHRLASPRLGALLVRGIGRRRIEAALREAENGDNSGGDTLTEIARLLDAIESDVQLASPEATEGLERLSQKTGRKPDDMIRGLVDAVDSGDVGPWIESLVPDRVPLPVYPPDPYGADPTVHIAVCHLLEKLRKSLAPYDAKCWFRLTQLVVSILQFVHLIRDELPEYCRCEHDNGKGQTASEDDLQKDLFRELRRAFGSQCDYEIGPIAGGRTDSGVRFDQAEFPIEVKHEFQHVNREHIRDSYLSQPSDYASARHRVSFLLILDLRASNAAAHRENVKTAKRAKKTPAITSLYTLRESFWPEFLPVDTEIEDARPSIVVVGLVPGNRPMPSSQTRYSERPRNARRKA